MLTITKEDYLRAIYIIKEGKGEVRSVDVAEYLDVSKPTVSEMVSTLSQEGFVDFKKYSKLRFTKKGLRAAEKLTFKHRVIELFLKNILKLEYSKLHEEAHRLEHAFSNESIEKIRELLGNPKTDPHGKPIPV